MKTKADIGTSVDLTIVSPVYNEEKVISLFLEELKKVLNSCNLEYEVLIIDDGSKDSTAEKVSQFSWRQLRLIRFVSNSGHMAALDAGIRESRGNFVVTLDSDLQHPPELIIEMYNKAINHKLDVIYAVRKTRSEESLVKRLPSQLYYKVMKRVSNIDLIPSAADFRLISSEVVGVIRALPVGKQVFRLLIPSLGFPSGTIPYIASSRAAGESKYTFTKMFKLWTESVVGHSTAPLTFASKIGFVMSAVSLIGLIYVLIAFLSGASVAGWASLLSAVLLLFGIQFIVLGIIGQYIADLVTNQRGVPPYIIRKEPS